MDKTNNNPEVSRANISPQLTLPNNGEIEPQLIEDSPSVFPESATSIFQQLKAKTTAILVGTAVMLPILALGTVTYYFGSKAVNKQAIFARRLENRELSEAELTRQQKLLATLLIGTGTTALLVGAMAAWGTKRFIDDKSTMSTEEPKSEVETQASKLSRRLTNEALPTQLLNSFTVSIRDRLTQLELLKTSVEEARKIIGLDRALIYQFDADGNGTIVAESVVVGYPQTLYYQVKDPCFALEYAEKYRQGRIQAIANIEQANLAECHKEQLSSFAVKASLVVPILQDEQLFGLFIGHQCSQPRFWKQSSIDLFAQLALQLGLALERVQLKEELSQGQNIQSHETYTQISRTKSDPSLSIKNLIKKFEQTTANAIDNLEPQNKLIDGEIMGQPNTKLRSDTELIHDVAGEQGVGRSGATPMSNTNPHSPRHSGIIRASAHQDKGDKVTPLNTTWSKNTQDRDVIIANSAEATKKIELLNQSHQNLSQMVGLLNKMNEKMKNNPDSEAS